MLLCSAGHSPALLFPQHQEGGTNISQLLPCGPNNFFFLFFVNTGGRRPSTESSFFHTRPTGVCVLFAHAPPRDPVPFPLPPPAIRPSGSLTRRCCLKWAGRDRGATAPPRGTGSRGQEGMGSAAGLRGHGVRVQEARPSRLGGERSGSRASTPSVVLLGSVSCLGREDFGRRLHSPPPPLDVLLLSQGRIRNFVRMMCVDCWCVKNKTRQEERDSRQRDSCRICCLGSAKPPPPPSS